jgi:hypothetical protein
MPRSGKHARRLSDTLGEVSFRAPVTCLVSVALAFLACGQPPAEFRVVGWEEARRSVEKERLTVVEALPSATVAKQADVPAGGGVLVFGLDAKAARASAATFARAGNRPVLVFIPRDADERGRFYAVASQKQEERRGKDS